MAEVKQRAARIEPTDRDRERFERYVDRSGGPNACHPWRGACHRRWGHGRFWVGGRMEKAHRVAWVLAGNKIPPGKPCVLHDCPGGDDPSCVNPAHLWSGTRADNQRDMAAKGRGTKSSAGLPFGVKVERTGRFSAGIKVNGEKFYLGTYDTPEEAGDVALSAKQEALLDQPRKERTP